MRLSVVIPCHKGADFLPLQLQALASQTWAEPWEVLVVDNRSTDRLDDVIERFKPLLPELRLIRAAHGTGAGYTRNVGVRHASSDRIAFCDADDRVAPGWVAAMGQALARHQFVLGALETHRLNPPSVRASRRHPQLQGPQDGFRFLAHGGGGNMGIRRGLFDLVGGFDEAFPSQQDTDLCWKVQLSGVPIHYAPEAVVHYRLRCAVADIYRQARSYGRCARMLYQRYRAHGMPDPNPIWGLEGSAKLAIRAPLLISPGRRRRWVWRLGYQIGVSGRANHPEPRWQPQSTRMAG